MNITVNREIVSALYSDKAYYKELEEYLNTVIDEEIDKGDDMNTDLIDECINALDKLENGNISPAAEIKDREDKIIRFCHKKTAETAVHLKRATAASIILIIAGSAVIKTNPVLAQQAKDFFTYIAQMLGVAADDTVNENSKVKALYGELDSDINLNVKGEEDIDLSKIKVIALYENNRQEEIPIEKCTVTTSEESGKLILIISYDGCAFSICYTLEG